MNALSLDELRALAAKHAFPDPDVAAAVAFAESRGHPDAADIVSQEQADAYNDSHPTGPRHAPERSFGLWQINVLAHGSFDEHQLVLPDYNAQAAFLVSSGGKNWSPWSTFTDGTYKKYLPVALASSADTAFDAFVLALVVAGVAYAKRRKLALPSF